MSLRARDRLARAARRPTPERTPEAPADPTDTATSCVRFVGWANRTDHAISRVAIWTSIEFSSSCSVAYTVTYANELTGESFVGGSGQLLNSSFGGTIEVDALDFSTPYTVTLTIADQSGLALVQRSTTVTTPGPRGSE